MICVTPASSRNSPRRSSPAGGTPARRCQSASCFRTNEVKAFQLAPHHEVDPEPTQEQLEGIGRRLGVDKRLHLSEHHHAPSVAPRGQRATVIPTARYYGFGGFAYISRTSRC